MGLNIYGDNSSYYITLTGMNTSTRYHVFVADIASDGTVNSYICRRSSLGTSGTWRYPSSGYQTSGDPYKYYRRPVLVRTSTSATSHSVGSSYTYNQVISGTSYYDSQNIPAAEKPASWYGLTLSCGNGISSFSGYKVSSGSGSDDSYITYSKTSTSSTEKFYISSVSPDSGYTYPIYATDGTNTWTVKTGASSWNDHYVSFSSTAGVYKAVSLYATKVIKYTYKITFNPNRGTGAPSPVSYGPTTSTSANMSIPDGEPTREGYVFKGWALSSSAVSPVVQPGGSYWLYSSDPQITMYAVWSKLYYCQVVYHLEGGTMSGAVGDYYYGPVWHREGSGTYTGRVIVTTPTKQNHTFLYWGNTASILAADKWDPYDPIDVNCTGESESSPSYKNIYAVWENRTPTYYGRIKYMGNNGTPATSYGTTKSGQPPIYTIASVYVKDTIKSTYPTRTGYSCIGWSKSSSATTASWEAGDDFNVLCASTDSSNPTEDQNTIYAVWKANKYTITFNANGGTPTPTPKRDNYNSSFGLTTYSNVVSRSGYTLLGWDTNQTATTPTFGRDDTYTIKGDATLYAIWKRTTSKFFYHGNDTQDAAYFKKDELVEEALTYSNWNALKAKISEVKQIQTGSAWSYTQVEPYEDIGASEYNDVRSAISSLSGHGTLPATKSEGDQVNTSLFNGSGSLKSALNTAIDNL